MEQDPPLPPWEGLINRSHLCRIRRKIVWTASSEFGTYSLCEQRRFRRACASAQSRQNLRCSLIQAVSQEEPSDRKPDPWPLWMSGHAQLKFVMTECSKTHIRLAGLSLLHPILRWKNNCWFNIVGVIFCRGFSENKFALTPVCMCEERYHATICVAVRKCFKDTKISHYLSK